MRREVPPTNPESPTARRARNVNVRAKASALASAWPRVTGGPPPSKDAVRLCLAQATHENHCGDDWPDSHNFGCCDYRPPTSPEKLAIDNGALTHGYWLYPDGSWSAMRRANAVAILLGDTHPGPGAYPMWFAAFPDDVAGATYFLKIVWRMASEVLLAAEPTVEDYVQAVYLHGYFEGSHPGARPLAQRVLPFTHIEAANVADYIAGMNAVLPAIDAALEGWMDRNIQTSDPSEPEPA